MTTSIDVGPGDGPPVEDLQTAWHRLTETERDERFRALARPDAEELYLALTARDQLAIVMSVAPGERRSWMRMLPPDDVADVLQEAPQPERQALLGLLDERARKEVTALLAYAEDDAGGLMNPRFARLRPEMTVDEAVRYLQRYAREHPHWMHYIYVLDGETLLGVLSLRKLFASAGTSLVREVMERDVVTAPEQMDQEALSRLFQQHGLIAIPVVDGDRRMKGIVTVDDIVDVVQEEATEDIQKYGGMEALETPYLAARFWDMVQKRAGWLAALFIGEMLTATAMSWFEGELARAIVLSLFVPLIISSGGNSGSQASTLVIRAMALGEVRLNDWWRVASRELASGLVLGGILGTIGFLRIFAWQALFGTYGPHFPLIALTVAISLVGVVMFGTLSGATLPFVLRRLGLDPASASAPFVATLVDVAGLVIYFTTAAILLRGTLL